jgi:hypothetical protein
MVLIDIVVHDVVSHTQVQEELNIGKKSYGMIMFMVSKQGNN